MSLLRAVGNKLGKRYTLVSRLANRFSRFSGSLAYGVSLIVRFALIRCADDDDDAYRNIRFGSDYNLALQQAAQRRLLHSARIQNVHVSAEHILKPTGAPPPSRIRKRPVIEFPLFQDGVLGRWMALIALDFDPFHECNGFRDFAGYGVISAPCG